MGDLPTYFQFPNEKENMLLKKNESNRPQGQEVQGQ